MLKKRFEEYDIGRVNIVGVWYKERPLEFIGNSNISFEDVKMLRKIRIMNMGTITGTHQ